MIILIFGGSGVVGSEIAEVAESRHHEVYPTFLNSKPLNPRALQVDVTDRLYVAWIMRQIRPDVVVHCASLASPDACEKDKVLAFDVNVRGAWNVFEASKGIKAHIVYLSTCSVFDGEKGDYVESDDPHPINYYGETMLKGEGLLLRIAETSLIVRTSMVYGSSEAKRNFASYVLGKLRSGEKVEAIDDQWLNPTLDTSLGEMVCEAAEKKLRGVFHLAGATRATRYDFALSLAQVFGYDASLVTKISMKEIHWAVRRQRDMSLSVEKARSVLDHKPLRLDESLRKLRCEAVS